MTDRVQDRVDIQELVVRYSDAVTRGDWDAMVALMTDDAVWESPAMRMHYADPVAFADFLRSSFTADSLLVQTAHGAVVDFTGPDAATVRTTVTELVRTEKLNGSLQGMFFDDVARTTDGWRFTHKRFVPLYTEVGSLTGHVGAARPVTDPRA